MYGYLATGITAWNMDVENFSTDVIAISIIEVVEVATPDRISLCPLGTGPFLGRIILF
jgi:hypothetical protein